MPKFVIEGEVKEPQPVTLFLKKEGFDVVLIAKSGDVESQLIWFNADGTTVSSAGVDPSLGFSLTSIGELEIG